MAIRVWPLPSLLVLLTVLALSSGVAAQCQVGIAAPPTEPEEEHTSELQSHRKSVV